MTATVLFTALLFWAILTIWVPERWPWALFQVGVFLLAGGRAWRARRIRVPVVAVVLGAAAAWPLLQLAVDSSVNPGATWAATLDWAAWLVAFLLALDLFGGSRQRSWFLLAITLGGAAVASVAVLQYYSSGGRIFWLFPSGYFDGVLGPFVNRNQYAAWVELLLPAALYLAATARRRALYGVAAAVLFGSVIASASRAGSALAAGEVLLVCLSLKWWGRPPGLRPAPRPASCSHGVAYAAPPAAGRGRPARTGGSAPPLLAQFACFALIAIAVVGWQGLRDRLASPGTESIRRDAVRASFAMVRDRPGLGSGLGTWPVMYPRYAGLDTGVVVNQAHNDWAQWAAEGGLPFLALMIWFAALLCKPAFRSIYGLGVVAVMLHALVDYPMQQRPALAAWWFAMAGLACAWGAVPPGANDGAYDDVLRRTGRARRGIPRGTPASV